MVHIVSHGPQCLDGVAAAVSVARFYEGAEVHALFSSNNEVDDTIRALPCLAPQAEHDVWITDISWTDPATDEHLRRLAGAGVRIHWFDHHRTAVERHGRGAVRVPFAGLEVSDRAAASRLVYEHLAARLEREGRDNPRFRAFWPVVQMADDNDRWLHRIPGSHELALTLRAMPGRRGYEALLGIDEAVTYTAEMAEARARVEAELRRSVEIAEGSRVSLPVPGAGVSVVAAVCDGYPSEVADRWGRRASNTVFALFDAKSLAVSLRRSRDCRVDLSRVAEMFGGGGHEAAAGCELPELRRELSLSLGARVVTAIGGAGGGSQPP